MFEFLTLLFITPMGWVGMIAFGMAIAIILEGIQKLRSNESENDGG